MLAYANPTKIGAGIIPPRRTLAIVGSHPRGMEHVPWGDPTVEIWLFNEAAQKVEKYPRWDALLQIHAPEIYSSRENWVNKDHWEWLQQPHGKPIYMQWVDPRVPDSVEYPLHEILDMIPFAYLRSSPAMALALAIHQGYTHIQIYGCELTSNTEYAYQATNMTFWIGFAMGRGVHLDMMCWQSEFEQPLYGYEGETEIQKSAYYIRKIDGERATHANIQALERVKSEFDRATVAADFDRVAALIAELDTAALTLGESSGALMENTRYQARLSYISRQEFERCSARAQSEAEEARKKLYHTGGKLEYVWNAWRQSGSIQALNQVRKFTQEKIDAATELGTKIGIYRENIYYMTEFDKLVTAAGGKRALAAVGKLEAE